MSRVVLAAVTAYAIFALLLWLATIAGADSLPVLMGGLLLTFACVGHADVGCGSVATGFPQRFTKSLGLSVPSPS